LLIEGTTVTNISRSGSRPGRRIPRTCAAALLGCILGLGYTIAQADDSPTAETAYARNVAVGVCGTCHGPQGNSVHPKFPRLAAQSSNYLASQLKNFRSQSRGDPDAVAYMWGMATELSDETIEALAHYYSIQHPRSGRPQQASLLAQGREIYLNGVPAEGVPACASCHGPDAHGMNDFPRLAGQHAQYLLKQLSSFQSNMRNVAVMHGVARNLRPNEMQAVAAFLESQP
jgi:cytochrome c553